MPRPVLPGPFSFRRSWPQAHAGPDAPCQCRCTRPASPRALPGSHVGPFDSRVEHFAEFASRCTPTTFQGLVKQRRGDVFRGGFPWKFPARPLGPIRINRMYVCARARHGVRVCPAAALNAARQSLWPVPRGEFVGLGGWGREFRELREGGRAARRGRRAGRGRRRLRRLRRPRRNATPCGRIAAAALRDTSTAVAVAPPVARPGRAGRHPAPANMVPRVVGTGRHKGSWPLKASSVLPTKFKELSRCNYSKLEISKRTAAAAAACDGESKAFSCDHGDEWLCVAG